MNFFNKDEKKAGAPMIPGASPFRKTSAFGKTPMFSRAAGGIMDRLKNLSRRDMAFVGIGLSVLVMAPVAEYMISQPPQDNLLRANDFAQRHGDGPFEPGINGLSQGSADGSGEVITPLSARDPASLILGAQPAQPVFPPAVTAPPSNSWRDAVTDSGRAAFNAASKAVGAPTVIPKMQSALRGMSFFGGDGSSRTSGALGGGKIIDDAKSASSKAAKRSMVGPVAMAGYKGVASTPNSASKGAFEKLRSQADKSAGNFSGGSAMTSLDKAAADAVQIGAGTGGTGGLGSDEKTGKTNSYDNKYKHERSGESLAEMAAKQRMQKELEWEFFKKYEIKKTIVKAVVDAFATTLGKFLTDKMETALQMKSGPAPKCWIPFIGSVPMSDTEYEKIKTELGAGASDEAIRKRWCTKGGGPQESSYVTGDKSQQSYQKLCPCNAYAGSGSSSDSSNPAPGADTTQNPLELTDFDTALKDVVKVTAQVEPGGKRESLVKQNYDFAVGDFKSMSTAVNGPVLETLRASRDGAQTAYSEYITKVTAAQTKLNGMKPSYDALVEKIKELEAVKQTVEVSDPAAAQAKAAEIQKIVAEWNASGPSYFREATGLLGDQHTWQSNYPAQLRSIDSGILKIKEKQKAVDDKVAAITSQGGDTGAELSAKFSALTGKTIPAPSEDAPEAPATKSGGDLSPLEEQSALRGVQFSTLWPPKEEALDETKAETDESAAWNAWVASVTGGPAVDAAKQVPDNMVSNPVRAVSVKSHLTVERARDLTTITKSLESVQKLMDSTKSRLAGQGITIGNAAAGDKPTEAADGNKPPVNSQAGAKRDDAAAAKQHRLAIDACYNGTSGFKEGASANCSIDRSNRVNGIATLIGRYEGTAGNEDNSEERKLYLGYLANERTAAHTWAASCLATVPPACKP